MGSDWYPDPYFAYIRSPEWRGVVTRYFHRHPCRCAACLGEFEVELHHKTYARLEAELDSDLAPLCRTCHSMVHGIQQISSADLAQVTELWIQSFRTQPNTGARRRATFNALGQRPSAGKRRSALDFDNAVHVGLFSYVSRRGTSFVTWSTFRRRPKVVWICASLERSLAICESIDRRAQALVAESAPKPKTLARSPNRVPDPQSSGLDDVEWFVRRPANRVPSIRAQLAGTFSRNRNRSTESFGYAKNLPATQNYKDDV
jgi:hypothetical protein